jgi:hypothetical protein
MEIAMPEDRVFQVKLPMKMQVNKGGDQESLNLNVYRNLHYFKLNHQKRAFQDFVKPLLSGIPSMESISLHYEINSKGESRLDIMNVGSIVDKFFSDALVHNKIILDDNYKHIVGISFSFGSLHPQNPHVLVTITETQPRKVTPMRILLDQNEIQKALESFVQTMGLPGASGVKLIVLGEEIQAEIIMNDVISTTSTDTEEDQPRKRGRVPGSKNKPKDNNNVATDAQTGDDLSGSGTVEGTEEKGSSAQTTDSDEDQDQDGDEDTDGSESTESSSQPSSGSPSRGNLFADSDDQSSEGNDPRDEEGGDSNESTGSVTTPGKRPSIFDVD